MEYTRSHVNHVGELIKGYQGLVYDIPYIDEGQEWGLTSMDLFDGEEQVGSWIQWIKETMKDHMFVSVNYLSSV
jgi:hypothetical protein